LSDPGYYNNPCSPGIVLFDLQFFSQEKTEEPTPRKRSKEREEGRIAQSKDLSAAVTVLSGMAAIFLLAGFAWDSFNSFLQWCTNWMFFLSDQNFNWTRVLSIKAFMVFLQIWLPISLIAFIGALTVSVAQAGFKISVTPLIPKPDRFNPASGLKRMFSLRSFVESMKALLKAGILFLVIYFGIKNELPLFYKVSHMDPTSGLILVFSVFFGLIIRLGMALFVLGLVDYGYQKWEFTRSIKMTKQEVKDEFKQTEGDPLIRQRIRSKQMEIGQKRMMSQVPDADVVVTNPTHFAVALQYDRGKMEAPLVIAKGAGYVALKIREIAEGSEVPVVEDKTVARGLYKNAEIGEIIPEDLYVAVAEILAYVYSLKKKD